LTPFPEALPEPWLRGIATGVDPVTAHLLRSSEQIREDLTRAIGHLTLDELWAQPNGSAASAGFHAKHLAGSTERLCTYLEGFQLTEAQLAESRQEQKPGETAAMLIAHVESALAHYESLVRNLQPEQFGEIREVGRRRLPVTAIGLAIHIAEHGQRHAGQAISVAKVVCLIDFTEPRQ
jgi:uncharacterized damage-inducible protein DinB